MLGLFDGDRYSIHAENPVSVIMFIANANACPKRGSPENKGLLGTTGDGLHQSVGRFYHLKIKRVLKCMLDFTVHKNDSCMLS